MFMTARSARRIVRAIRIVPLVTCMVVVSSSSDQPACAQAPDAAPPGASQPTAPSAASTPEMKPPAPDPAAWRSTCERYVAALSGDAKQHALLNAADVQDLAKRVPDLLTCSAVKDDSDAPCKLLGDEKAINSCRAQRSIFHELRTYPNGRAFMFNDVQFEDCGNFKALAPYCESFRAAARAGDASKCEALGELQSNCRAQITLDKSLCTAPKGENFQGHDKGSSKTYGDNMAKDCESQVESMAIYTKGMKAVAESGSPLDRQLAKAALGEADACAPSAQAAMKTCIANPGTGLPSDTSAADASAPGATPKEQPPR